jgi:hypothetical protein
MMASEAKQAAAAKLGELVAEVTSLERAQATNLHGELFLLRRSMIVVAKLLVVYAVADLVGDE